MHWNVAPDALSGSATMDHMQKNGLNNAHHLSGVPRKQQLRHAFLHSMHTLVIEKIARTQRKNLQLPVKVKELL